MSALSKLFRGLPGHPIHPPLTDATIGAYTVAAVLAVIGAIGWAEEGAAKGMWLALLVALAFSSVTVITGLADYFQITRGTPLNRTATLHGLANAAASVCFVLAAVFQHEGYRDGRVTGAGLLLTLVGFGFLTIGGYLGGTIVFVHGMRVLGLTGEPTHRAVTPGLPEKEAAEGADPQPADSAGLHDRPRDEVV